MDDLSGQVLRGYKLNERIGKGGFGVVYRALQESVDREVAIKIILPQYANRPYFIRNFEYEARLIARLEHIHIVPLYDYWREPDGAYIVMRWLRGGNLHELLKDGPLEIEMVARNLEQIASALSTAHSNGVIHQDLKSANILLDEERNAYLTDFGIAKDLTAVDREGTAHPEFDDPDNIVRGSPEYMSPEQILDSTVDARTDIYSLGILLFEMLTGVAPFQSDDDQLILQKQLYEKLPPLQQYRPDLPEEFNVVIQRATDKHPKRRYNSPLSMAQGFREFVNLRTMRPSATDFTPPVGINTTDKSPEKTVTSAEDLARLRSTSSQPVNPYKGLRAFQEADAADFFGRGDLVNRLLIRLNDEDDANKRFLAVIGPSGSGKSSAVRAGLIPSLRKGGLPTSNEWFYTDMIPGGQPLEQLAAALNRISSVSGLNLAKTLQSEHGLYDAIQQALGGNSAQLVLFIDQFEEVFTLAAESQRSHLLKIIHHAVTQADSPLRLIITMRADFYDRPLMYNEFGDLLRLRTEVVLPLTGDELRESIIKPAERVGLNLEPGLVDEIIADISEQPGALPLLQYALTELYNNRSGLRLTRDAYHQTGGVSGAMTSRADELFERLSQESQDVTRQLFLRLVALGEGTEDTRRRALRSELSSIVGDQTAMDSVMEIYGKYRLLAFDREPNTREPTVEIAHEALISKWGRLRNWVEYSRDDLRAQRQLAVSTREWIDNNRDHSFLASGIRLGQFEEFINRGTIALNLDEMTYIQASMYLRAQAQRRRNIITAILSMITLIATIAAFFAFDGQRRANSARDNLVLAQQTTVAERDRANDATLLSRSRELAITSLNNIDQLDQSLLLVIQALDFAETYTARSTLLTLLQSNQRIETMLHGHTDWVRSVAYNPEGTLLASGSADRTVRLWDVTSQKQVGQPLTGHQDWINTIAFSPDGKIVASGSADATIRLWDVETGDTIEILVGHEDAIWDVVFSPDGSTLASASADSTILLWDVETGEVIQTLRGHAEGSIVFTVDFHPQAPILASGADDNTILIWQLDSPNTEPQTLIGHEGWVYAVTFNPTGNLLASASSDNTVRLWTVAAGQPFGEPLTAHTSEARSVEFASDGFTLFTAGFDGVIWVWNLRNLERPINAFTNLELLPTERSAFLDIALQPNGQFVASAGQDNRILIWDSASSLRLGMRLASQSNPIADVALDDDMLITVDNNTNIATAFNAVQRITVGTEDSLSISLFEDAEAPRLIVDLDISPDGTLIASSDINRQIYIHDASNGDVIAGPLDGHNDIVFSIAFSPDGQLLASGGDSGSIVIWSASDDLWQPIAIRQSAHNDRILSLSFNPDGSELSSGSRDGTVARWNIDTNQIEPITDESSLDQHSDGVLSLAYSMDGQWMASGDRSGLIVLRNLQTGAEQMLTEHSNMINALSFDPKGRLLASGGRDESIILWDLQIDTDNTIRMLGGPIIGPDAFVNALTFSTDGQHLLAGYNDGSVMWWDTSLAIWIDLACYVANRNFDDEEVNLYIYDVNNYNGTCLVDSP